ncbi:hemicentin-1-like [Poeciliopsis prolifica]|uniref:hemicentin-1-like n=1 Tax=Poeciliopsis prolifica TaxID=188132 RepID=UPI0024131C2C|nr:hemicentin-1-like [Poeciliopsis prolifica]
MRYFPNLTTNQVFFNSSGSINTRQMEITGDLTSNNCSTRISDLTATHRDKYILRIENEGIKKTFCENLVIVTVVETAWAPTIDVSRSNLKERQSVTVSCSAYTPCVHSPPELTWNLKRDSIGEEFGKNYGTHFTRINNTIKLTYHHDGLNISCSARYPVKGRFKHSRESVRTLNVSYAPKRTAASIRPLSVVSVGNLVELICFSRANPPPTFAWFKIIEVDPVNDSSVYSMIFTETERGDYFCEASNDLGTERSNGICLDHIDFPVTLTINIPFGDLKEHQSITVTCSASTPCAFAPPELTWNLQQDSIRQLEGTTDGTFVSKLQETIILSDTHDGYNIRCFSKRSASGGNKTTETEVTLSVLYAPKDTSASISPSGLVSTGSWVELNCSSRAKPPPRFTWFRLSGGGAIELSEGQVYNFSVTTTQEGEYYCEATNEIGSEKSTGICIGISDALLTANINIPVDDLKEGQSVTISCSVSTPCPQIELTWNLKRDSLRHTEGNTDGTFTNKIQEIITLSDTHDGYNIRCSARYLVIGGIKTAETEVTLSVSYAPKDTSASISPSDSEPEGSWVELNCSSRAKPPPKITWFKTGRETIKKVSSDSIFKIKFTGGDEYYCLASNKLGKQKSSMISLKSQGGSGLGVWIFAIIGVLVMIAVGCAVFILDNYFTSSS